MGCERGVVLPLALIMLVTLTSLMVSVAVLAQSEPVIASNQMRVAQALSLADSGAQLAAWGLSNPGETKGVPAFPIGSSAAAPYDGNTFINFGGTGGFTVQVSWDAAQPSYERTVTAVGWVPSKDVNNLNPHRKAQVVMQFLQNGIRPLDPPCALCIDGQVKLKKVNVDSRSGGCPGATGPPKAVIASGDVIIDSKETDVYGYGNDVHNEIGADYTEYASSTSQFKYTAAELSQLKAIAQANGTYFQGPQTSLPAQGVIVYIDTVDGTPFTASNPDSNAGKLELKKDDYSWSGIVIVAGTVKIDKYRGVINGLVYALNDVYLKKDGTINGAVVSENRRDKTDTDSKLEGEKVQVNYNCQTIRTGGGTLNTMWTMKPGTYLETAGY